MNTITPEPNKPFVCDHGINGRRCYECYPCNHDNAEPLTGSYRCRDCDKTFDIYEPEGDQPEDIKASAPKKSDSPLLTAVITSILTTLATLFVAYEVARIILDPE